MEGITTPLYTYQTAGNVKVYKVTSVDFILLGSLGGNSVSIDRSPKK